mmetsp:Transcript_14263/g.19663  ORF Transcript_14263/g.19663 Transcript_14263/m.19663 type:complete len:101 (+) Transcript_14263:86-388(+)
MNTFNRKQKHARKDMKKKRQVARKAAGVQVQYRKESELVSGKMTGKSKAKARKLSQKSYKEKARVILENLDSTMGEAVSVMNTLRTRPKRTQATTDMITE